jgi:hypothetical protein
MAKVSLPSITSTSAAPPTGQPITGRQLSRLLHGASNAFRAMVATKLVRGSWVLVDPSPVQAARLCDGHVAYVTAKLGCAVRHGPRAKTIDRIDRIVKRHGAEAVRARCDRATAPNGDRANGNRAA